ncbi:hypothetical protein IC575_014496 [Cucumis melo]
MIHQPASSFYEAQTVEFIRGERTTRLRNPHKGLCTKTGKPLWVISEDMERDVFMSQRSPAHGIVDLVAVE